MASIANVRNRMVIAVSNVIYIGTGPEKDTVVEEEQAYQYALERCLHGTRQDQQEFKEMLVGWFYSGNWEKINVL